MISYAQNGEDVLLWRALKDIRGGFYIDVGANDPELLSVTKWFYDQGWTGINIEPEHAFYEKLCEQRPRDINLEVGAGTVEEERTFYVIPDTGLSTFEKEIADAHTEKGFQVNEKTVKLTTLARICQQYAKKRPIHFLKVDVEGAEEDVLRGMDFQTDRPWVLVVEATVPLSTQLSVAWDDYVRSQGYIFTYFDGLSYFYVAEEKAADYREKLSLQANVFDDFERIEDVRRKQKIEALTEAAARQENALEQMAQRNQAMAEKCRMLEENKQALEQENQSLEIAYQTVLHSHSWRMTAPLRELAAVIRAHIS